MGGRAGADFVPRLSELKDTLAQGQSQMKKLMCTACSMALERGVGLAGVALGPPEGSLAQGSQKKSGSEAQWELHD
jgi:hypothetical protein